MEAYKVRVRRRRRIRCHSRLARFEHVWNGQFLPMRRTPTVGGENIAEEINALINLDDANLPFVIDSNDLGAVTCH